MWSRQPGFLTDRVAACDLRRAATRFTGVGSLRTRYPRMGLIFATGAHRPTRFGPVIGTRDPRPDRLDARAKVPVSFRSSDGTTG